MGLFRSRSEREAAKKAKYDFKLKKLAIKKDVALSEDLRNTAADNLMLASLGIDHTIDENNVKVAKINALDNIANGVLGVFGGAAGSYSGTGTIQNPATLQVSAGSNNSMVFIVAGVVLLLILLKK